MSHEIDRFEAKLGGAVEGDSVHAYPHANATSAHIGAIDLVTANYVRVHWRINEGRYDTLARSSPLWAHIEPGKP